jgi:hypothetical protein
VDPDLTSSSSASLSTLSQRLYSRELNINKSPFGANVSRQIVPTDELIMAIAQETAAEELLKEQQRQGTIITHQDGSSEDDRQEEVNGDDLISEASSADQILSVAMAATQEHDRTSLAPAIPFRSPHRGPIAPTHQ